MYVCEMQIYYYNNVKYSTRIKFHVYHWAICYPTLLVGHSLILEPSLTASCYQTTMCLQKPPLPLCTTSGTTLNQAQSKFAANTSKV